MSRPAEQIISDIRRTKLELFSAIAVEQSARIAHQAAEVEAARLRHEVLKSLQRELERATDPVA
jgi:hypothetical protein